MEQKHQGTGGDGIGAFLLLLGAGALAYGLYKHANKEPQPDFHKPDPPETKKPDESAEVVYPETIKLNEWTDDKTNLEKGLKAYEDNDYKKAFELLLPEAEYGEPQAQFVIGELCYKGEGIKKNNVLAYMWLSIAYKHGQTEAKNILELLGTEISQKDFREARDFISDYENYA